MQMRMNEDGLLDVVLSGGAVVQETGFETIVLTSILLNRRANPDDVLPYGYQNKGGALGDDRQGWVGDILDERGRLVGSRLWLLDQELATEETIARAYEYIEEALQHLIDDGHASSIDITHEWQRPNRANLFVSIFLTNGNVLKLRWNYETGGVYVI